MSTSGSTQLVRLPSSLHKRGGEPDKYSTYLFGRLHILLTTIDCLCSEKHPCLLCALWFEYWIKIKTHLNEFFLFCTLTCKGSMLLISYTKDAPGVLCTTQPTHMYLQYVFNFLHIRCTRCSLYWHYSAYSHVFAVCIWLLAHEMRQVYFVLTLLSLLTCICSMYLIACT